MSESSNQLFDIVFRGDILPGQQLLEVKKRLAQLFKADEQKINSLFTGAAIPLKRNLEKSAAERYQAALRQAGADVQVAPAGKIQAKKPARRPERKEPAQRKAGTTLKERLAAQESQQQETRTGATAPEAETTEAGAQETGAFTLAPAGADLLKPSERAQDVEKELDLSAFSLRENEGFLVDPAEIDRPAEVLVADLDAELSEPGADLLSEEERNILPLPEIEVPDVDLAPTGSDLGQLKDDKTPLNPDISGLSLE
ncbi:hypothetical protein HBA55_25130 [Pseudomaricurvus alkylphenolicus]|uniref:hypothetical protein n=1 Tax=Pseudomaricurvus alkylphenolicus TaxID=1306991 RepID=UPI00141FA373|nr:hypothetical protein [Pseudomaricurvus alkylphenolicus]NIB42915.1 hypothetical protein [Pseudomaricurvus alkylphenolicus]